MRPEKKKSRHHDSVNKRKAALAKEKGGAKEENVSNRNSASKSPEPSPEATQGTPPPGATATETPVAPANFKGVRESGDKLITEANERYVAAQTQEEDPKYAKRNITSNWTKFELPPSEDESEDESQNMTGADFSYVLSTATGAESHFRLKSEKEWDTETDERGAFSNEFFSLDVHELERAVMCVPFHLHIGLKEEDFDKESQSKYKARAERNLAAYESGSAAPVEEEISQKIMDILSIGKVEKPKEVLSTEIKENLPIVESEDAKKESQEKEREKLEFLKPEMPPQLEQRQRVRRSRGAKTATENSQNSVVKKLPSNITNLVVENPPTNVTNSDVEKPPSSVTNSAVERLPSDVTNSVVEIPQMNVTNSDVEKSPPDGTVSDVEKPPASVTQAPLAQRSGRRQRDTNKQVKNEDEKKEEIPEQVKQEIEKKENIDKKEKNKDEHKEEICKQVKKVDDKKEDNHRQVILEKEKKEVINKVVKEEDEKKEVKSVKQMTEGGLETSFDEKKDLEFLESIDKPKVTVVEEDDNKENKGIVPVKIVNETKDLEDWLDDFLDD